MIVPVLATLATAATITTMAGTVEELEARLDRGDWLLPGEVAKLLGIDRTTVIRAYLNPEPPKIRFRRRAGSGGYRECHPGDVRAELDRRRQVHGES
ncbi:hypothetical protein DQE82_26655 [Micromonospora sp. LHW51205]|uniref:hypothetical protein n=1 Tax=Micromonospora sp. LHW51205 TaxID=2248752 RepID=UPI000DEAB298|nr:hypothetical protein [Micromonospora sp. LHW51205]RBQ05133.1 hypothetical protein DQE82_26655 [Micromonospora sp. LHW51205]